MNKNILVNEFSKLLTENRAVYFVGAGISKPSKLKDWFSLLKTMEGDIGIEIKDSYDLTEIAQYIVNHHFNNKGRLINKIVECFTTSDNIENKYHKALAQTNLKTIWTTNYDTLLEKRFGYSNIVVKRTDTDLLPTSSVNNKIEIIKMHGSIDNPSSDDIVITKEDYEDYSLTHPLTTERLRSDLLNKSFLFIGYSYRDPNIKLIMTEVRHLCKKKMTTHYMITEKAKDPESIKIQKLWIRDLLRYGINTYMYEHGHHDELEKILFEIARKSKGNTVFVTGSHEEIHDENLLQELGNKLSDMENVTLVYGQSEGVGNEVVKSFFECGVINKRDIYNKLKLYPNPYANNKKWNNKDEYLEYLTKFRTILIKETQVMIVLPGGKGTKVEIDLAKLYGTIIIPVLIEDKIDFINELLTDNKIIEDLLYYDPEYTEKLRRGEKTTVEGIIKCLEKILN